MLAADRLPIAALPWPVEESALRLGGVGLAIGSALGAWVELVLLLAELRRVRPSVAGEIRAEGPLYARFVVLAAAALLPAAGLAWAAATLPMAVRGPLVVGCYALAYLGSGRLLGWLEPRDLLRGFER
jgi:peptidoglycan biosynthesis protein MviN/MurJ (putative lipid II flippase)